MAAAAATAAATALRRGAGDVLATCEFVPGDAGDIGEDGEAEEVEAAACREAKG